GRRNSFGLPRLPRRFALDDYALEVLRSLLADEDVNDGAIRAGTARRSLDLLLGARPAIADPDRNAGAIHGGRRLVAVHQELTQLPGGTLGQTLAANDAI